jgi:hypothetical protein
MKIAAAKARRILRPGLLLFATVRQAGAKVTKE